MKNIREDSVLHQNLSQLGRSAGLIHPETCMKRPEHMFSSMYEAPGSQARRHRPRIVYEAPVGIYEVASER